ncbi:MAG: sulfatase [Leptolyngbyaceae cyanobacterium MO_188.B28]|nr:sulfatase [Leptolyngbyaceae cyanobacterium MO_188.B28]
MERRKFLQMLGGGAVTVGAAAGFARPRKRPNLLLITADDMGVTAGCYGDTTVATPRLDALAKSGVQFMRGYVTQASCSSSRSSMFTGLYPHQNGQLGLANRGYTMHRGVPTLPMLLKQNGYRTGVFGKVHVHPESDLPFDWNVHRPQGLDTRDVRACAAYAEQFLQESGDTPWFLLASFSDPHKPFPPQVEGLPEKPIGPEDISPFAVHGEIDTPAVRQEVAGYYNAVQRVDWGVGLLLDLLERTQTLKDTLIVFVGDHGPPFSRGKTTCYEFGVHVPFLVAGRGVKPAVRSEFVSTVDIMPTLLRAARIDFDPPTGSRELQPILLGGRPTWRESICTEFTTHGPGFAPQRAIRDDRYKLIHNLLPGRRKPGIGVDRCKIKDALSDPKWADTRAKRAFAVIEDPPEFELYDLTQDPIEYDNLAGRPEGAEVEQRLKAELLAWRRTTQDPLLDANAFDALKQYTDDFNKEHQKVRAAAIASGEKPPYRRIDMTPFQRDWE